MNVRLIPVKVYFEPDGKDFATRFKCSECGRFLLGPNSIHYTADGDMHEHTGVICIPYQEREAYKYGYQPNTDTYGYTCLDNSVNDGEVFRSVDSY